MVLLIEKDVSSQTGLLEVHVCKYGGFYFCLMWVPPICIHVNRIAHDKPNILGVSQFMETTVYVEWTFHLQASSIGILALADCLIALEASVLSASISGVEGGLSVDLPFAPPLSPPLPLTYPFPRTISAQLSQTMPPKETLSVASFDFSFGSLR